MESLFLATAPPLDPEWLAYESAAGLNNKPKKSPSTSPLDHQHVYADDCRARTIAALSVAPYSRLANAVRSRHFTVPSSVDGFQIPVIEYSPSVSDRPSIATPAAVVFYIHGGGLCVGEADSEELSCRLIAADAHATVFSVGYRLMPTYSAQTCLSDCMDAFKSVVAEQVATQANVLLVGSSSGGELAALVAQQLPSVIQGVVLRCPVTSDAFSGVDKFVPKNLQHLHTSATDSSFWNSLLGPMLREVPRDGLERMPLEAPLDVMQQHPRTWVQLCTNDSLFSDGLCYAKALEDAGIEVKADVVRGWPHTFWLKAPLLPRALEAERSMLEGLAWVAGSSI